MSKLKRFIALAAAFCMFSVSAYAETRDVSYKVTVEGENVSVVEDSLTSETDYSDLYVNVIKDTNGQQTTIYSGALGGYADGAFADVDFSEINFMVVFDWNTMEEEAIYIIPATQNINENDISANTVSTNEIATLQNTEPTDPVFSAEAVFWNTNEYTEFIAENTDCLGVDLKLKNISEQEQYIQPYIALYENNRLCEAKVCSLQTFEAGEEISYREEFTIDTSKTESYTVKVFNWNDNLKPMTNAISINAVKNDYFSNSIDSASTITTEKNIRGKINSSEDIDYIQFTPTLCDYYDIESADNINITLLKSNNQLVEKELNNKYYLDKELYYLKISAETATEYLINIDRYAERVENLTATINEETSLITLSGTVSSADERLLTVTIYNPENVCEQVDTVETSSTGVFTYSYKTPELLDGSYQAVINNYELASQGWLTFDSGTSSEYIDKNTYQNEKLTLINSETSVSIDGVENSTSIVAGKDVVANVSVHNESELAQNVSAVLVFYDENNSMIDYMSISKEISPSTTETFTPTITLPTDKTTSKIKVFVLNGNGIYDKTNSVISNVLEISNGQITRYEFEELTDETLSATSTAILTAEPFSYNELKQIKENLSNTLNSYQPTATSDYEPWGVEFNQSGEKTDVDVTVSTNDVFYEKYLTKTGTENYYLTIKNKQSKPVYAVYYINTSYESSPGEDVGFAGDRYFHIYVERIEANKTKEINIEIPSNELYNEYGEYGHQLGFGVADIGATWNEIDWFDVSAVNLYPSHRNSFGNSFDNGYKVISNTSNNAVFEGKIDNSGDTEYLRFTPTETNDYLIQSSGTANIYGELYNSSKSKISSNNIGGTNSTFSITANLTKGQTYYIKVGHNTGYAQGTYKINIGTGKDPYIDKQWGLEIIDVEKAWKISTGEGVKVAVFDGTPQFDHEDFGDNMLTSEYKDLGGDGTDAHPTHISGIIAAKKGNGVGIAGVAPNAKIVPVNTVSGVVGIISLVEAIAYAQEKGVKIVNISAGTSSKSELITNAFKNADDILFVCSAGNAGQSTDTHYPSGYDLPNIISVANMQESGSLYSGSNHTKKVHVAAPGTEIYSTYPNNTYANSTGTSMAAPFVCGIAALVASEYPSLSGSDLRNVIEGSVVKSSKIGSKVSTGGYVNAYNALNYAKTYTPSVALLSVNETEKMDKTKINLENYLYDTTDIYVQFLNNDNAEITLNQVKTDLGLTSIEICNYFDFVDTYKIRISDKEKTRAVIEKLLTQDNVTYAESTVLKLQN